MYGWPVIPSVVCLLFWSAVVCAQSVPTGYQQVASEYDLPPALLYAVALTESGQSSLSEGRYRPWPWALAGTGSLPQSACRGGYSPRLLRRAHKLDAERWLLSRT